MTEINDNDIKKHGVLSGGGEMGKLIRAMDWTKNPLGPIENWPQSLLTTVSLCLASNFPICLIWGKEHVQIYNDGYIPICGALHPKSLGMDFTKCWAPAMPIIGKGFFGALAGEASFVENQNVFVNRYGFLEELFVTVSFSPIRDESGEVGGVFHPLTEQTSTILSQRRTKAMRDLSARTGKAKAIEEVFTLGVQTFADYKLDLPFAIFYILEEDGRNLRMISSSGLEPGTPVHPIFLDLEAWPISEVINSGQRVLVDNIGELFGQLSPGPYPESPNKAIIIPINTPGSNHPLAILVVGVSARLALNDAYLGFYDLLTSNINAAVANAHAYEQESKRAEALAAIDKAKTVFFSNVSHEFRTPLTLMLGPLEELLNHDTSLQETSKEQIQTVHRNSLRLLKLVNALLDFSRIEAGRLQAVYIETDICGLTLDLSSSFRSTIEKAGIVFTVKCHEITDQVYVDRTMWERIIFNLLSNAFKFTFNGEISLSIGQAGNNFELTVKDTGTGIPKEELPKLFSRFHRVENALGRTHEGSGIGLAMVQELVKLHGGSIHVESKLGEGSSFIVLIPTGKEHLDPSKIADANSETAKTLNALPSIEEEIGVFSSSNYTDNSIDDSKENRKSDIVKDKILIADDNEDMLEYLTRLLKSKYEVIAVKDGSEALEAAEKETPSLILSDVMMPKLDGFGLVRELKARDKTRSIPVIFLSARAGEEATIEGMEVGADDYLVKPFSSKELLSRINSNIKISRQRSETEIKLRNLFEQAPVAICILKGPLLIIELANEKMLKLWGKKFEEVINIPTLKAFPEIVSQGFDKILNHVYTTGESFIAREMALDLVRHEKIETVYVDFVYDPLLDYDGKINGIVAIAVDVTDMVRAKQKLMESEAYFRMMADNTPSIIWITDPQGLCTYLNKRWYEYTGQTETEASELGWLTGVHPDDIKQAEEIFIKANQHQEAFSLVYRIKTTDGTYRWALDSGMPKFNSDGAYQGFVGSVVDIHERKLGEESLHLKNEQLTKINNDLDNFIYTASHDLKAPMSNIEGLLGTLRESQQMEQVKISDDTELIMKLMEECVARFKTTILDLTEITIVQKVEEEDVKEIYFEQVLEDVKFSIYPTISESGAIIRTDFTQVNAVKFSKKNLNSILYNLLSNAIKYREKNRIPEILIKTEKEEGFISLTVQDNGLGLSLENQSKMFTMFKRFHNHVEGTGIGLYIVKRIIDNAGGKIMVESEVGRGTTFKVFFKS